MEPKRSDPVPPRGDPASALLTLRIIHAAMIVSIALYGMVLLMVTRAGPAGEPVPSSEIELRAPRGEPPGPVFTIALAAVALVTIAAIFVIRARKLPRTGKQALFDEGGARRPAHRPRTEYFTLCILTWAMAESIAIYGLVLGILHHALLPFVPFALVSLLVMVLLAPRRRHIEAVAASDGPP
jgi:F0F1-type ATP synthase membrane subunit c/vacuolar-type H+-ATPase subunit K